MKVPETPTLWWVHPNNAHELTAREVLPIGCVTVIDARHYDDLRAERDALQSYRDVCLAGECGAMAAAVVDIYARNDEIARLNARAEKADAALALIEGRK